MALVLKDRVLESSTSTGTGSFTLTGAQTGYQSFSAIGNGNTTYYTIQGKNPDGTLTGEWEVGIGTWSTGNTLSRDTVLSNSLGTTANIVFSAGAKDVFCDYPASKSVNQNADNKVLIPYTSGVTNVGSLNVGDATAHTDSGVIAAFTASEPLYLYTSLQNTSSANTSYASYAVNDGGHTSYGELGINNSNYSYTAAGFPNNTFSAPLATFVESYGGPLAIGTWDSQKISFIVNGSVNTADAMTISATGNVSTANDITVNGRTVGKGAANYNNLAFGEQALFNAATTGIRNVGLGYSTLYSLTTGTDNIAIGYNSQTLVTTGSNNIAIGTTSLYNNITGSNNVAIGNILFNVNSDNNIGIGTGVGGTISKTIGIGSGVALTSNAIDSIFFGYNAGNALSNADNSVIIGSQAFGLSAGVTNSSVVIGKEAYGATTGSSGDGSIAIGYQASYNSNTTTQTVIGYQANFSATSRGNNCTAIGYQSLYSNGVGSANATLSASNTAIGHKTLFANTTGRFNTALGHQAGWGAAGTNANTTGASNIYIGYQTVGSAATNSNEIVIGASAVGLGSGTVVIGSTGVTLTQLRGVIYSTNYTVATLPTSTVGARAFVTDALAPVFGSTVTGGGAVAVPVYVDNAGAWRVG